MFDNNYNPKGFRLHLHGVINPDTGCGVLLANSIISTSQPSCVRLLRSSGLRHLTGLPCSALHPVGCWTTTTPADFCRSFTTIYGIDRTKQIDRSQRKTQDFHPIYPPHLLPHLLDGYRALSAIALSPRCGCLICGFCSSGRTLLTASFRFGAAPDTRAVRLTVPPIKARRGTCTSESPIRHPI